MHCSECIAERNAGDESMQKADNELINNEEGESME